MFKMFEILFSFLFWKDKFIELEVERIIEANLKSNIGFREKFPSKGSIPQSKIKEWENFVNERVDTLWTAISKSFVYTLIILISSAVISYFFYPERWPPKFSIIFGAISTFLILWATFGQLGWEIQTLDDPTYVEQVNQFWFRIVFSLGMFFLFMAIFIG